MKRGRLLGVFRVPGRPVRRFAAVWAGGIVAMSVITKLPGGSSGWVEAATYGAFAALTGTLVVRDWQGFASYLVQRRMESRMPTGSWMGEEEPDPEGTRRTINGVAGTWAGFGALLLLLAVALLILRR